MRTSQHQTARALPRAALVLVCTLATQLLAGCASGGAAGGTTAGTGTPTGETGTAAQPTAAWPVRTLEHLDLWLHGYALLQRDTARVPVFRRGYRDALLTLRRQRGVSTQLDANSDWLQARLAANPALVNGQFLPLYFGSWEDMRRLADIVARVNGDPRQVSDPQLAQYVALVAATFPTAADREWLQRFTQSLEDERARFYHDYWLGEQRTRASALRAVENLWNTRERGRLQTFLNNTQQAAGELILSLPLNGEGRTINNGKRMNLVAVGFPADAASAPEAVYVFAHEVVGAVTSTAVTDNITPAEQRSGAGARLATIATVRGGAMLLERVAPDLAAGYMRYYLRSAGASAPSGDPRAAFVSAFALPEGVRDAIARQLETVLGGI